MCGHEIVPLLENEHDGINGLKHVHTSFLIWDVSLLIPVEEMYKFDTVAQMVNVRKKIRIENRIYGKKRENRNTISNNEYSAM